MGLQLCAREKCYLYCSRNWFHISPGVYSAYRSSNCDLPVWGHPDTWIIFLPVSLPVSVHPVREEMETWTHEQHTLDKQWLQLIISFALPGFAWSSTWVSFSLRTDLSVVYASIFLKGNSSFIETGLCKKCPQFKNIVLTAVICEHGDMAKRK